MPKLLNRRFNCRRWVRFSGLLCVLLAASGCTAGGSPSGSPVEGAVKPSNTSVGSEAVRVRDKLKKVEPANVGSISYDGTHVLATVVSTGCTSPEHFEVVSQMNETSCLVTLMRNRPDFCRRAPFVMEVSVAWELPAGCEREALVLTNPIVDMDRIAGKGEPTRTLQKP